MRDFSLDMLRHLLLALRDGGYPLTPFERYWFEKERIDALEKVVLFRHDVDRLPRTALTAARMEYEIGSTGRIFSA